MAFGRSRQRQPYTNSSNETFKRNFQPARHDAQAENQFQSWPYECRPDKNMLTPRNAKVVTSKPVTAHQAAT